MKLIKQLDVVSLLLWCILSFNLIENINSSPITSCLDLVEGQVIYPNDEPFRKLIIDENIKVNYTPSALVYAVNSKDVQIAVNCAVKLKTDIIARSGGHSYENYGLGGRDDVIVLDVTNFNEIIIDSGAKTAKVGAGNRLGAVYDKLNQAGFLIPAGSCPSVGIGGHALGGGYGFYSRKYGLVSDNVISMEMVDASGNLLQINSTSNPDLFFALRGAGGGSYGIVISFVFRIHPTPPQVTLMQFDFNQTQVQKLFDVYNKIGPSLDDGIVLQMSLGKGSLSITGVYLGSSTKARNAMKEFLSKAPKPTSSEFKQQTFFDSVIANSQAPKNEVVRPVLHPYFFKAKSFIVKKDGGLTPQAIKTMINFLNSVSCDTFTLFDLFDGGATHIVDNTSSFIHRDVLYVIQMVTSGWKSKEQGDKCIKELNDFGKKFQSNFTSYFSYQNYIDRDLDDWQTRYYGDNFKKLVEIKAKYDPNNLFNFPQSIPVKI